MGLQILPSAIALGGIVGTSCRFFCHMGVQCIGTTWNVVRGPGTLVRSLPVTPCHIIVCPQPVLLNPKVTCWKGPKTWMK